MGGFGRQPLPRLWSSCPVSARYASMPMLDYFSGLTLGSNRFHSIRPKYIQHASVYDSDGRDVDRRARRGKHVQWLLAALAPIFDLDCIALADGAGFPGRGKVGGGLYLSPSRSRSCCSRVACGPVGHRCVVCQRSSRPLAALRLASSRLLTWLGRSPLAVCFWMRTVGTLALLADTGSSSGLLNNIPFRTPPTTLEVVSEMDIVLNFSHAILSWL